MTQSSFARDVLPWFDDVSRFAMSLTRNADDADDLVQDTYLKAYRSWHTFRPGSNARAWLLTICRNTFLRSRERARTEVVVHDRWLWELSGDDPATEFEFPGAVWGAIDRLKEPFRSTILLVDVADHTYEVVAAMFGVPIGTIRSRLFRARRQIRQALTQSPSAGAGDSGAAAGCRAPAPDHFSTT